MRHHNGGGQVGRVGWTALPGFLPDDSGASGSPARRSSASRGLTGYEHGDRTIVSHARALAASRPGDAMTLPEGLIYAPGFLTETEERDVLGLLATPTHREPAASSCPPLTLIDPCATSGQAMVAHGQG